MKRLIVSYLVICSTIPVFAQQPGWDSTHRPGNFQQKVEQFKSYPNSKKDIIFFGNSITAGTDWSELLSLPYARNRGISGDITFGLLERLEEVTEGKPAKVFILIGINDISRNIPDSFILRNYRWIIQRIKKESPATKIYFQTLLPVNNEYTRFPNHYNKDEHILYINSELKKMGAAENIVVIDLYPHFLNAVNKLEKKYTDDGLHLNIEGYRVWKEVLQKGGYLK